MTTNSRWQLAADVLRAAVFVSAGIPLLMEQYESAARCLAVGTVLVLVRWTSAPPAVQLSFVFAALVATWANVAGWYPEYRHVDTVVHGLVCGTGAAVASTANMGRGVAATLRVLFTLGLGAVGAVLWEFYEWAYESVTPLYMTVGYTDTLADLAAGLAGAGVAGLLLSWGEQTDGALVDPDEL